MEVDHGYDLNNHIIPIIFFHPNQFWVFIDKSNGYFLPQSGTPKYLAESRPAGSFRLAGMGCNEVCRQVATLSASLKFLGWCGDSILIHGLNCSLVPVVSS